MSQVMRQRGKEGSSLSGCLCSHSLGVGPLWKALRHIWGGECCGKKKAVALGWPHGSLMLSLKIFSMIEFDSDKQRKQPFLKDSKKVKGQTWGNIYLSMTHQTLLETEVKVSMDTLSVPSNPGLTIYQTLLADTHLGLGSQNRIRGPSQLQRRREERLGLSQGPF